MSDQRSDYPDIQEGDLLAYLEGVAPPEVAARIAASPALSAAAAELRLLDTLMGSALQRSTCPELDDLLLYQAGLMTGVSQQQLARHIQGCPDCRHELAQLATPAAPPLPERLAAAGRRLLDALRVSAPPQPALALRGNAHQQLEYQAGDYHLLLAIIPPVAGEDIWQIEGQISHADAPAALPEATVQALRADNLVAQDSVDEFGFFALDQLPAGSYTLQIDLPEERVMVADVIIA